MDTVFAVLGKATGKTISKTSFGEDPPIDSTVHRGEYVVFEFTDGSALEVEIHSNAQSIVRSLEDGHIKRLQASDFHCMFFPKFRTPRQS
jgi:hypothetical protein